MNIKSIRNILGKILMLEAFIVLLPLIICLIYKESLNSYLSYGLTSIILIVVSLLIRIKCEKETKITAKDGLIIVGLSWVSICLFGAFPFLFNGATTNYFDAFFETCSGFSTTGCSIFTDVESLDKSILFYRALSQWFGGMGVLVLILSIMNNKDESNSIHLLRAESTGTNVGKLDTRMKSTTRTLYLIYVGLTVLEFVILVLLKNPVFDSLCLTLSTLATGGFSILNTGVATYSIATQYVIALFMLLAGINFSLYYYLFIKQFKKFFTNEELRCYLIIVASATIVITLNILKSVGSFEKAFRYSLFSVISVITTTGFSNTDFALWPSLSLFILLIIMLLGSCAGSTAGGLKISRFIIVSKSSIKRVKTKMNENRIETIKLDGVPLEEKTIKETKSFFITYIAILTICGLLVSLDGSNGLVENFTASLTCLSNVGPGLGNVGPAGNFASYSYFSKMILSIEMIIGRLELYPILSLFFKNTWSKY